MRDLLLWRLLHGFESSDDDLASLLNELAELPVRQRGPYLGAILRLQDSTDVTLRCAVARNLAGACGRPAWLALVRLLGDGDAQVRAAALAALAESSAHDPARWCHAVFHPAAEVRAAALGEQVGEEAEAMRLHLLADPACRDVVAARLPRMMLPPSALATVLEFVRHGLLPEADGRRIIARMRIDDVMAQLAGGRSRSDVQVTEALLASRQPGVAADDLHFGADGCDDIFALFWDDASDDGPAAEFCGQVIDAVLRGSWRDKRRLAASILATALHFGAMNPAAAELCAVLRSEFFLTNWIASEERRRAAKVLYRLGSRVPKENDGQVELLLLGAPVRRASGQLDLWFIGALLHFAEKNPYEKLQKWYRTEQIVGAFWESPRESAPFFCLHDAAANGRSFLIERVAAFRRPQQHMLLGLLLRVLPGEAHELIEHLEPSEGVAIYAELSKAAAGVDPDGQAMSEPTRIRVAEALAWKIAPTATRAFLIHWLDEDDRESADGALGREVFVSIARETTPEDLVRELLRLKSAHIFRLLDRLPLCLGVPYAVERRLHEELRTHPTATVRARIEQLHAATGEPTRSHLPPPPDGLVPELTREEHERLATCWVALLEAQTKATIVRPMRGVCAAFAARTTLPEPSAAVCAVLLASHDDVTDVAAQLRRYGADDPIFLRTLDLELVHHWQGRSDLGLLAHAWLNCWETHNFALAAALGDEPDAWQAFLRETSQLPWPPAALMAWQAVERVVALWRYRDRPKLIRIVVPELVRLLVEALDGPLKIPAARMLAILHGSGLVAAALEQAKPDAIVRLPNAGPQVAQILMSWINTRGAATLPIATAIERRRADEALRREIAECDDVERLEQWCRGADTAAAEDAALRLVELGDAALLRLAALFAETPYAPAVPLLAESVSFWPEDEALAAVRELMYSGRATPRVQFVLGVGLCTRGEAAMLPYTLAAVCRPAAESWFQPAHWRQLERLGASLEYLAHALAISAQPNAYVPAVTRLLAIESLADDDQRALAAFLDTDSQRLAELRLRAARKLWQLGDDRGFPLLLAETFRDKSPTTPDLLARGEIEHESALDGFMTLGNKQAAETLLVTLLEDPSIDEDRRDESYRRLLLDAESDAVRTTIAAAMRRSPTRFRKLRRTAQEFAWGVRVGRELTGRLFTVEMLAGDDLGYTRFSENKIYVNPLPLLRGEQNGGDVLRALIVHELGHHMYHRGPEAEQIWKTAADHRMHSLLNLVADEHLERNLRALSPKFGDPLKRLAAYAFQHSQRQIGVPMLLASLQHAAFHVLTSIKLGVARRKGCVVVDNGRLLRALDRNGSSFARFVRALRMGLGLRSADARATEALALFRGAFRRSTMPQLYDVALRLREIFGNETQLLDVLCQQRSLAADGGEITTHSEGIDNDELQSEVRRILEPPSKTGAGSGAGDGACINVNPREDFPVITRVEKLPYDPAAHKSYASRTARPAAALRRALERLGSAAVPQQMRLRGKSLDRTRLRALVLRSDPRILVGREIELRTDLFLGIVVDCSGSMQTGDGIEKARLFGTLLCEACRGLKGVDVRVFGFTDSVIYDAGDAERCAAPQLVAGGGNNDAAGLWYAAQVAMRSRRKAKLLVMISDGLPTECSTAALKSLVKRLSQQRICCAQVAVRPLEEVCFPHYVLLDGDNLAATVRRFGEVIIGLVTRTLNT